MRLMDAPVSRCRRTRDLPLSIAELPSATRTSPEPYQGAIGVRMLAATEASVTAATKSTAELLDRARQSHGRSRMVRCPNILVKNGRVRVYQPDVSYRRYCHAWRQCLQ